MQPTSRRVTANGLSHHVLEWDGGGRGTALCLHGWLDLAWAFFEVGPALARAGWHVVAPDLRGHGDSDRVGPGGYYHFADYLFDVADLADQLARDRLVLVGHSMGGAISTLFAGAFPGRAGRVVAMEGVHLPDSPLEAAPGRIRDWVAQVRRVRERGAPKAHPTVEAAAARLRETDPRCPPATARFLAEVGTRPAPGGFAFKHDPLHLTRSPYPFRLDHSKALWREAKAPVLLVEAAQSETPPPPDMDERVATFPDARRARIEEAGHMMMRHQPVAVARTVLDFIGEP